MRLKADDLIRVLLYAKRGYPQTEIAAAFGVSPQTVMRIVNGKSHKRLHARYYLGDADPGVNLLPLSNLTPRVAADSFTKQRQRVQAEQREAKSASASRPSSAKPNSAKPSARSRAARSRTARSRAARSRAARSRTARSRTARSRADGRAAGSYSTHPDGSSRSRPGNPAARSQAWLVETAASMALKGH